MKENYPVVLFFGFLFAFSILIFNRQFLLLFDIQSILDIRNAIRAIGIGILCIAAIIYIYRNPRSFTSPQISLSLFDVAWLGFIGLALLSILWAYNTVLAINAFRYFTLLFILYHLIAWFIRHFPRISETTILKTILIISVVYVLHTVFAIYDLSNRIDGPLDSISIYKIRDLVGHKSLLATMLFFMAVFNFWAFVSLKKAIWKYIAVGLVPILVVLLVVLQARGMLLGLVFFIASMSLYGLLFRSKEKRLFSSKVALGGSLSLLVGLLLLSFLFVDYSTLLSRLDISTFSSSRGASERFGLWKYSWGLVKENTILGVGANNWKVAYQQFGLSEIARLKYGKSLGNPHNDILKIWSELGTVGIMGYLSIILLPIIGGIQTLFTKQTKETRFKIWLLCTILIAYQISAFFTGHFYRFDMQLFVCVIVGFIAYYISSKSLFHRPITSLPNSKMLLLIPLVFLLLNTAYNTNRIKNISASRNIRHVLKTQKWDVLRNKAKAAHSPLNNLWGVHTPIKYYEGLANYQLGDMDMAVANFKEGLEVAHPFHYQSMSKLGQIYLEQEKYKKAKYHFKQALAITPVHMEALLGMAQLHKETGKLNKSRYWLQKINFPLDTLRRNELLLELDSLQKEANINK